MKTNKLKYPFRVYLTENIFTHIDDQEGAYDLEATYNSQYKCNGWTYIDSLQGAKLIPRLAEQ